MSDNLSNKVLKKSNTKCQWCGLQTSMRRRNKNLLPPTDGKLYPITVRGETYKVCSLCIKDLQRNPTLENWLKSRICDCCHMPSGLVFMGVKVGKLSPKVFGGRKYKLCPECKANINKKSYNEFLIWNYKGAT